MEQVDERLVDIDGLIEQLNRARAENRNAMRTLHMDRFQVRQQLQTDDEEIAALQQQIVDAEKQLYELKLALNKKLAEQPAYQEASEAQEAMIQREGEIAREVTGLHDERVALQIERKRLQMELDAAVDPAAENENHPEQETP